MLAILALRYIVQPFLKGMCNANSVYRMFDIAQLRTL
jgi:hypothetical protein